MIREGIFKFPTKLRVVIPTAPFRYVTRLEKQSNSWYDVSKLAATDPKRYKNEEIEESVAYIHKLIDSEANILGYSKVFIGGFS